MFTVRAPVTSQSLQAAPTDAGPPAAGDGSRRVAALSGAHALFGLRRARTRRESRGDLARRGDGPRAGDLARRAGAANSAASAAIDGYVATCRSITGLFALIASAASAGARPSLMT